jgi:hypothetical protein
MSILLIGLPNSGKSFFIDSINNTQSLQRQKTFIDVTKYKSYTFTEIGGSVPVENLNLEVDYIFIVIRDKFHEANSLLLMVCEKYKVPVVIIWNEVEKPKHFFYPRGRRVCSCTLNFQNPNWFEKFQRILEFLNS